VWFHEDQVERSEAPVTRVAVVPSSRSKRELILRIAAEEFGRKGFDATKWATIAESAGIGNTALYHYFESKTHCLFTLMLESYEGWYERWSECLSSPDDPVGAIRAAVAASFQFTEADAIKARLLMNEQGKLSTLKTTGREETVRNEALRVSRRIEALWIGYLGAAMEAGTLPQRDPRLLAHSIIGLLQSVWAWYRPAGKYSLRDLDAFYSPNVQAMLFA
jgi:TetR/AcrR family transcriptional regulator, cholesterol catabolism regulator